MDHDPEDLTPAPPAPAMAIELEAMDIPLHANSAPLFHLADRYRAALIGHTVSGIIRRKFIYSLNRLVEITMESEKCSLEQAQEIVFQLMLNAEAQHGTNAPTFVDDAISQTAHPRHYPN